MTSISCVQPPVFIVPSKHPESAPQRIEALWAEMQQHILLEKPGVESILGRLGVTETDQAAHSMLMPMIKTIFSGDLELTPSEKDTGVYFLSSKGETFAVFKVGEKRGRMELLARHIAHRLGLEKHALPGIFYSIQNPVFPKGDIVVELYNGNQKVFTSDEDGSYSLTGILEPFISSDEKVSIDDFAHMTMFALVSGLRDAKESGIVGATFIDTEELMPVRLLPSASPDRNVAATNLPYLEHPLASVPLPQKLLEKVNEPSWSLFPFLEDLKAQKIEYADIVSEDLISGEDFIAVVKSLHEQAEPGGKKLWELNDGEFADLARWVKKNWAPSDYRYPVQVEQTLEVLGNFHKDRQRNRFQEMVVLAVEIRPPKDNKVDMWDPLLFEKITDFLGYEIRGWDHGGCSVEIQKTHAIIKDRHHVIDITKTDRLLSDSQLEACAARVCALKRFLEICSPEATVQDMVEGVDPLYAAHMAALKRSTGNRHSPPDVVGRFSPDDTKTPLTPNERQAILERSSSAPPAIGRGLFQLPLSFSEEEVPSLLKPFP